ncbi:MAG: RluA family pseudouridine synthase [Kiritimatiellia bacterium]|jgi:RluA family pseudouridine synthase
MHNGGFTVEPDGTRTLARRVTPAQADGTLLDVLRQAHPSYVEADILDAIASGALTLDGRPAAADARLAEGMRIAWRIAPRPEPEVDDRFDIVFEDDHLAVVSKSGNLPCHPAGRYQANTLLGLLAARHGLHDAALVNRIDRETSGLVLVAKTREAASACGALMMAGGFDKRYLALVEGSWPRHDDWREVRGKIVLVRGDIVYKKREFRPDDAHDPASPTFALTRFRRLRRAAELSLLEVEPVTGRPHQIRATLKAIGFPLVGDKLYGVDETIYARMCADAITPADRAALRMRRQALHAKSLAFRHPFTRQPLAFEAPLPPDEPLWRL